MQIYQTNNITNYKNQIYTYLLYIFIHTYIYIFLIYLVAVKEHYCLLGRLKLLLIGMRLQKIIDNHHLLYMVTITRGFACILHLMMS